jgi:integrase
VVATTPIRKGALVGVFKRCKHTGRAQDRCKCAWWSSFQHRGRLYRVSLSKWGNEDIRSKEQAKSINERFRQAVREGRFFPKHDDGDTGPLTFNRFADLYAERYVKAKALKSGDTIDYRMKRLRAYFGAKLLRDIRTADIEDFIAELKQPARLAKHQKSARVRKPATINRFRSLLHQMFSWAEGREYIDKNPFRRGNETQIKPEREDNRRHRRLTPDEEQRLMAHARDDLKLLIIFALDTGMRRGEMLAMTWADVDDRGGWLWLRGETTKSRKTRKVPVSTTRLRGVLDFLRLDADSQPKPSETQVFTNEVGEPIRFSQRAWKALKKRASITDLRWHDLRHEYASRLAERGVPLCQVHDLLGHASIVTTERYDNQRPEALMASAKLLETGESFTFPSHSGAEERSTEGAAESETDRNVVEDQNLVSGVSDGDRTRDFRSHSPALYH